MKYFVVSDIHSYYREFKDALRKAGFDCGDNNHILILCGDAFDRGPDAKKLLRFLLQLQECNRLIYIKGNHEYLMEDCLKQMKEGKDVGIHHWYNKTLDTIFQLTGYNSYDIALGVYDYKKLSRKLSKYRKLVAKCIDYYELNNYIFVHGWIPHIRNYYMLSKCKDWEKASWSNGMEEWHNGWTLDNKTIVCGHWHTSFGNYLYHNKGSGEFESNADFGIFEDDGIIALDACTAFSKKVNILVIET